MKVKLAVFASGSGSNFKALQNYFNAHEHIEIALLLSNVPGCGAVQYAEKHGVPVFVVPPLAVFGNEKWVEVQEHYNIHGILLAGFLKKIPAFLIQQFSERILNIHPSLLPAYGGKGMYGMHVHKAVLANKERESGISIHLVNEAYDEGALLGQFHCMVLPSDSPGDLAQRVLQLEHYWYPRVVEWYFLTQV
jgi:phosphoribosylglycinamide formyltransferase 1